jgi:hypothetical protein
MGILHGRAGRLTAKTVVSGPGRITVAETRLSIYKHKVEMEGHAPGSFFFTDTTGDKYTLRCLKAGKHAVALARGDTVILTGNNSNGRKITVKIPPE